MAKLTYLQLVNRVLKRISLAEAATLVGATGTTAIVTELINEAQNELWTETTNWYSLFKMRRFKTAYYSASTIAFNNATPATITDSANGFVTAGFIAGMTISVTDPNSNNTGVFVIATAAAGTLTLQTGDTLTAGAAGSATTIYAATYPVASDFGRAYHLVDLNNNRILTEDATRAFSEDDPEMDSFNEPTHFSMQGDFYRFHFIPDARYSIIDRYWKIPTALSANTDTSDLPIFCENFIIYWTLMRILEYLNKFEAADRLRAEIYGTGRGVDKGILQKAKIANNKILDQMLRFQSGRESDGLQPPKFSSHYGARYS